MANINPSVSGNISLLLSQVCVAFYFSASFMQLLGISAMYADMSLRPLRPDLLRSVTLSTADVW
jgi:hypothetical protein